MTKNLADSRNEAMSRLISEARARGGIAIVATRFDTTELGDVWTEIGRAGRPRHRGRQVHRQSAGIRHRRLDPVARMLM
jgi:hypothetical protein